MASVFGDAEQERWDGGFYPLRTLEEARAYCRHNYIPAERARGRVVLVVDKVWGFGPRPEILIWNIPVVVQPTTGGAQNESSLLVKRLCVPSCGGWLGPVGALQNASWRSYPSRCRSVTTGSGVA